MTDFLETPVVIVGGGPAGLTTAIELGRRGVSAILIELATTPPSFPKANATTSRSMEHYRRLGFADKVRRLALPAGYPDDITYLTRYSGTELTRLSGKKLKNDDWRNAHLHRWPTAEPLARVQQMDVESVMREQLAKFPSVTTLWGWEAIQVNLTNNTSTVVVQHADTAERREIQATYVVGADGPRSVVREAMGFGYEGQSDLNRAFFGGKMMATYFTSDDFYAKTAQPSWQYWAMNTEQRALLCALRERNHFVQHTQLKGDEVPSEALATKALKAAMGDDFQFSIIGVKAWTAGFALVAEAMANSQQRPNAFLVGDAAHLFTPTGGQGYNTSVDDAVNLGWKLAAVCQGWGGDNLLASYAQERRPIAKRNTQFARAMAESIGNLPVPENIEENSEAGQQSRDALQAALAEHVSKEFDIPGITYGVSYFESDIVVSAGETKPHDSWNEYTPSAVPGSRSPHLWLNEHLALQDCFGDNFTLIKTGQDELTPAESDFINSVSVPLDVLRIKDERVQALYGKRFVLIRPDHHVAWRSDHIDDSFIQVMATVTGASVNNVLREEAV